MTATATEATPVGRDEQPAHGRYRVLVTSTISFTLLFAVWMQFGILGVPIQKEFGLSDTAFYWLTALPVLNGAIWRLWTGILADRWGGRIVMTALLAGAAIPTFLLSGVSSGAMLFVLAFLIGFAGNSFQLRHRVEQRMVPAVAAGLRPRCLRRRQRRRERHQADRSRRSSQRLRAACISAGRSTAAGASCRSSMPSCWW